MRLSRTIFLGIFFVLCSVWGCHEVQKNEMPAPLPEQVAELSNLTILSLDTETTPRINLVRDQIFGDTDDVFLGSINNVAVDNRGRIFISDFGEGRAAAVYGFEPDGSFIIRIGREGEGPGEFQSANNLQVHSGRLFIYDRRQWIHVYDLDSLTLSHSIVPQENFIRKLSDHGFVFAGPGGEFFVRPDDTFLVNFGQRFTGETRYLYYFLRDTSGNIIPEKIFKQRDTEYYSDNDFGPGTIVPFTMPYTRRPLITASDEGYIYSAWTEDFLIRVYDPSGEYVRAYYSPYKNSKLSHQEAINMAWNRHEAEKLQNNGVPETWPALHSMILDDKNRLWVLTVTDDDDYYTGWVFEESGDVVGIFSWAEQRQNREFYSLPLIVKNGYLYSHEIDKETGLQTVVRYRIEME